MPVVTTIIDNGDHVVIDFEGLTVVIGRDCRDGALRIDVDSSELELSDIHPGDAVPRLRLVINESVEQLDTKGAWQPDGLYPPNILDHLAAT